MAEQRQAVSRPLSPHLQIYRVTITMAMSIIHRFTGMGLYAGTALVAWWLVAAATGPEAYATFQAVAGSWIGQLVLFGFTWALLHHLFGGLRYLLWDAIVATSPRSADIISWAATIAALLATVAVWFAALSMRGVL
ncbi:Succinate dehydrogenase cytochrome b556 subunit [Parvibaculum lavamentivorans DS-1]|uniref:Succinate dehydrogenase cytochrome b556 subunit n=1 Tax=Parvibaculum lavamentivorans (strain DS-1 / DSM 13023 / NCIMB 13966) TaxID=402881 RepID=A7HT20_PARL1|nr:succinate dehydrogenase, cytochrome b556 subunit [Parvibaculum lavamentivorans]ABS63053.1 Succinate dehydrogenase cytochrome b556 subunit [Parvibaculum lavamentivorans DS-1]